MPLVQDFLLDLCLEDEKYGKGNKERGIRNKE